MRLSKLLVAAIIAALILPVMATPTLADGPGGTYTGTITSGGPAVEDHNGCMIPSYYTLYWGGPVTVTVSGEYDYFDAGYDEPGDANDEYDMDLWVYSAPINPSDENDNKFDDVDDGGILHLVAGDPYYMYVFTHACASSVVGGFPFSFGFDLSGPGEIVPWTGGGHLYPERVNMSQATAPAAVYQKQDPQSLDFYSVTGLIGTYVFTVDADYIAGLAAPTGEAAQVDSFSFMGTDFRVFWLDTGELQVNIGPDEFGVEYVYIIDPGTITVTRMYTFE